MVDDKWSIASEVGATIACTKELCLSLGNENQL